MAEQKRIPCPYCTPTTDLVIEGVRYPCSVCGGADTIPDRRAPSAAERAVERIKAECTDFIGRTCETAFDNGMVEACGGMLQIINEEAARG